MPGVKMVFEGGDQLGRKLQIRTKAFTDRQTTAVAETARRAAADLETEGRANIRQGGNFSSQRWIGGLRALVSFEGKGEARIRLTHAVPYWKVFEFGATIRGRPLLWIPLSFSRAGQLKVRAKLFPGQLFRVNRAGKNPLLMDESGPQYVGVPVVKLRQRWHLRDISKRISRRLSTYYREAMRNGR